MMSKTRTLFTEALNPYAKIANSINKKLNYIESSIIINADSFEEIKDFLIDICEYHSAIVSELSDEAKREVAQRIYSRIHGILKGKYPVEENNTEAELETKIYNFLKANGGIMYPLEVSAKKLAQELTKK